MPVPTTLSAIDDLIKEESHNTKLTHTQDLHNLALQVQHNLQYQHDWTSLAIHTHSPLSSSLLPRPIISGVPPRRVYIHPDEQIKHIKAGTSDEDVPPVREWVLPSHLAEHWSLRHFADVFDEVGTTPPDLSGTDVVQGLGNEPETVGPWTQVKRLLLATIDDDSTVVYYVVHDGIVKPRQN